MRDSKFKEQKVYTILANTWRFARRTIVLCLKLITYIIGLLLITPLSILVPKKNIVVLASRFGDFEGNLKYLFLYLNNIKENNVKFVFLTEKNDIYIKVNSLGLEAWKWGLISTFFKLMQAKVVIVDGNEWAIGFKYFVLYRALKVQIWHGTGLKAIGLLKPNYKALGIVHKLLRKENVNYDLLVLTSEYQQKTRAAAFKYKNLVINGLPRNDIFFNDLYLNHGIIAEGESIDHIVKLREEGFKLVTYAPTWRKRQNDFYQLDLVKLDQFAVNNKLIIIIKLHYKHECNLNTNINRNVIEYNKYSDIYPLLAKTDLLITDYSSIYLDYLLLDKAIIFFPYDHEQYIDGERELLLDYNEMTPGPKCYNQKDLEEQISRYFSSGLDEYSEDRTALRKLFFQYVDGLSSERLWDYIKMKYM